MRALHVLLLFLHEDISLQIRGLEETCFHFSSFSFGSFVPGLGILFGNQKPVHRFLFLALEVFLFPNFCTFLAYDER